MIATKMSNSRHDLNFKDFTIVKYLVAAPNIQLFNGGSKFEISLIGTKILPKNRTTSAIERYFLLLQSDRGKMTSSAANKRRGAKLPSPAPSQGI
jgi:hypothetical protein